MPACPKCKSRITSLLEYLDAKVINKIAMDSNFVVYKLEQKIEPKLKTRRTFKCPICKKIIFRSIEKAKAFLETRFIYRRKRFSIFRNYGDGTIRREEVKAILKIVYPDISEEITNEWMKNQISYIELSAFGKDDHIH